MMLFEASAPTVPTAIVQSDLLMQVPGVVHGITSRVASMGLAHGNVAYSPPRDQDDAWTMRAEWCARLGLDAEAIVTAGQVHGAATAVVERDHRGVGARPGSGRIALCDALLTRSDGPVLMTLHADCLPIILVDPESPAVACVHAGWRGTVADVAGSAVGTMAAEFGSDPARILAFLGPSICRRCYEVGDDVAAAWRSLAGVLAERALDVVGDRYRLDLKEANRQRLLLAGLDAALIDTSPVCTKCQGDDWFSHRGQGPETGRFGAIVAITAG
jgi:YfiH family protein